MPVDVATAASPMASAYSLCSTRTRGSWASVRRSSSRASATLSSVAKPARSSRHRSSVGDGHAVGRGQAGPLVGRAERDVVARLGQHLGHRCLVEHAAVGEADPAVLDHPDADALALGRLELLDLTLVDPHAGVERSPDVGLDLLARPAACVGDPLGDRQELASASDGASEAAVGPLTPPCRRW